VASLIASTIFLGGADFLPLSAVLAGAIAAVYAAFKGQEI
jgi:hypothetical protein